MQLILIAVEIYELALKATKLEEQDHLLIKWETIDIKINGKADCKSAHLHLLSVQSHSIGSLLLLVQKLRH